MFTRSLVETTAGLLAAIVIVATAGCWSNRRFDEDSFSQLQDHDGCRRRLKSGRPTRPRPFRATATIRRCD
jgi:hypothetical protein